MNTTDGPQHTDPRHNPQRVVGPFPVWWTLVRFAVPDRVKGS